MTWCNEAGTHSGWGGCLLAATMLVAFWAAVIAALTALLGASRPQRRPTVEGQLRAHVTGLAAAGEVTTAKSLKRP